MSSRRGRASRSEPSPRKLRRVLAPLAACVATLGRRQERVLVRRAGLRGFTGGSRAEVAARLGITATRVARLEHRALRSLRRKARGGDCSAPESAAAAVAVPATRVSQPLPAGEPAAPADRQEVEGASDAGGGVLNVLAEGAPTLRELTPGAAATTTATAARSYADDHPAQFALAVLVTLLCALLLVRELRRDLRHARF